MSSRTRRHDSRLRALAACAALLVAHFPASLLAHHATTEHAVCAVHGGAVHVDDAPEHVHKPAAVETSTLTDFTTHEDTHDDCAVVVLLREDAVSMPSDAAQLDETPSAAISIATPVDADVRGEPLHRLAPKRPPPAPALR